jgi:hypothetical protein
MVQHRFKIKSKIQLISVEVKVEIGSLIEAICEVQITHRTEDEEYEYDWIDLYGIKYMGVEINGYKEWGKCREYHMELGIDLNARIDDQLKDIFTQDVMKLIITYND